MAKELAMLERNEAGQAARKYFLACEAELQQNQLAEKNLQLVNQANSIREMESRLTAKITDLTSIKANNPVSMKASQIANYNRIRDNWLALVRNANENEIALEDNELVVAKNTYMGAIRLECLKKGMLQYDRLIGASISKPTQAKRGLFFDVAHNDAASLFDFVGEIHPFDVDVWHDWQTGQKSFVLEGIPEKVSRCWDQLLQEGKL